MYRIIIKDDRGQERMYEGGKFKALLNGYDYEKQVWVKNGKYVKCGHPETMDCQCYGKKYEGLNWS